MLAPDWLVSPVVTGADWSFARMRHRWSQACWKRVWARLNHPRVPARLRRILRTCLASRLVRQPWAQRETGFHEEPCGQEPDLRNRPGKEVWEFDESPSQSDQILLPGPRHPAHRRAGRGSASPSPPKVMSRPKSCLRAARPWRHERTTTAPTIVSSGPTPRPLRTCACARPTTGCVKPLLLRM